MNLSGSQNLSKSRSKAALYAVTVLFVVIIVWQLIALELKASEATSAHEGFVGKKHIAAPRASHVGDNKRVAVAFFGLTRSLTFTHESINTNLLGPLRSNGYEVDVFMHTYDLPELRNSRSSEAAHLNRTEWRLLETVETMITNQQAFLKIYEDDIEICKKRGSGWPNDPDFQNMRNVMCQLNSVHHVSTLWQKHHRTRKYEAVIYARPDVLYDCPFPITHLMNIKENTLYLPNHSQYGGLNDRFALARPDVAALYGNRLDYALKHCKKEPVHAERFVKAMVQDWGFQVVQMQHFDFYRVRATGEAAAADLIAMLGCHPSVIDGLRVAPGDRAIVLSDRKKLKAKLAARGRTVTHSHRLQLCDREHCSS